jgi:hypothetical protein
MFVGVEVFVLKPTILLSFIHEIEFLSPPPNTPGTAVFVNENPHGGWKRKKKCKSQSPNKRAVTSSNGNLERFRLFWAIDYATFYCSAFDVNEPSSELLLGFFGAMQISADKRVCFGS